MQHRDGDMAQRWKPLRHTPHHHHGAQDRPHQDLAFEFPDFLLTGRLDGIFLKLLQNPEVFVARILDHSSQRSESHQMRIVLHGGAR